MIGSIEYRNYRVLRDTTLTLGRFNLLIGPNGSGKSTVLQSLNLVRHQNQNYSELISLGAAESEPIRVAFHLESPSAYRRIEVVWSPGGTGQVSNFDATEADRTAIAGAPIFSLAPANIAAPNMIEPTPRMEPSGYRMAAVLDHISVSEPERFEAINNVLGQWLPEYECLLFDTPSQGTRSFSLRTRVGNYRVPASDLSHGTLIALALLTLAYVPDVPPVICFEEPDHGIHPRLLRDVRDALYRLSYPESFGESRKPVQVIATTHSPYLLDLFRDHPEEVIVAERDGTGAHFKSLSEIPELDEILQGAHLSELWYSGILGGVPASR